MFVKSLPFHVTGGMETHAWSLAKGITKRGHKLTIITTKHPRNIKRERKERIKIHYVGNITACYQTLANKISSQHTSVFCTFGKESLEKFRELNEENRFDIVHSQSFVAWSVIEYLKREEIPLVTTVHGTSISDLITFWRVNRVCPQMPIAMLKLLYNFLAFDLPVIRSSRIVIAVSDTIKKHLVRFTLKDSNSIVVIPNGVDVSRFHPSIQTDSIKRKYGLTGKRVILSVGRVDKEKGIQFVIRALPNILKRVKDVKLWILGSGSYSQALKNLVRKLNLQDKVLFTPYISDEELPRCYNACDLFVMPTIRLESFGLVLAEAMACEKPVIASRIGGVPDVIQDGIDGILVSPGDINSIYKQIVTILNDQILARKVANNARRSACSNFSVQEMVNHTLEVYEMVLMGKQD